MVQLEPLSFYFMNVTTHEGYEKEEKQNINRTPTATDARLPTGEVKFNL
jgi:hypothetical protein